ncbi:MAG: TIGR04255 family protein [Betaproteobacteria bacterium]|nr:TIGR04255 family protein [Betaproteobacteria bacterium]
MRQRPAGLPDFSKPPVGEVVLSLQFPQMPLLQVVHLGLFWNELRTRFPKSEYHSPVDPAFENFEMPKFAPGMLIRMNVVPMPFPRLWFVSENGTELVQIQQDRLIFNWRRTKVEDVYPRYEDIREKFEGILDAFEAVLRKEGISDNGVSPNQVEVTYLNQIQREGVWESHSEMGKVLRLYAPTDLSHIIGSDPEAIASKLIYRLLKPGYDKPIGRLHIDIDPGFDPQKNEPLILVNLLARGAPLGQGRDGTFEFMDFARGVIVKTFAEITTKEMHAAWGIR